MNKIFCLIAFGYCAFSAPAQEDVNKTMDILEEMAQDGNGTVQTIVEPVQHNS